MVYVLLIAFATVGSCFASSFISDNDKTLLDDIFKNLSLSSVLPNIRYVAYVYSRDNSFYDILCFGDNEKNKKNGFFVNDEDHLMHYSKKMDKKHGDLESLSLLSHDKVKTIKSLLDKLNNKKIRFTDLDEETIKNKDDWINLFSLIDYYLTSLEVKVSFDRFNKTVKIDLGGIDDIELDFSSEHEFNSSVSNIYENQRCTQELSYKEIDIVSKIFFTLFNKYADELSDAYNDQGAEEHYSSKSYYRKIVYTKPNYQDKEGFLNVIINSKEINFDYVDLNDKILNAKPIFKNIFTSIVLFLLPCYKKISNKIQANIELYAYVFDRFNEDDQVEKDQVVVLSTIKDKKINITSIQGQSTLFILIKKFEHGSELFNNSFYEKDLLHRSIFVANPILQDLKLSDKENFVNEIMEKTFREKGLIERYYEKKPVPTKSQRAWIIASTLLKSKMMFGAIMFTLGAAAMKYYNLDNGNLGAFFEGLKTKSPPNQP
jgi:hypothetical protein